MSTCERMAARYEYPRRTAQTEARAQSDCFLAGHPLDELFVSAVTFAEIRFGIERIGDAARAPNLRLARAQVRPMFEEARASLSAKISC